MIRVQTWNEFVSPKFYGPLAIWPWLKISPQSSLNVIYLIITAWQWLMSFPYMPCIPMQIKPIKACQGKGWAALPLREWPCCSFSSTGLGSLCELLSSQPQRRGHCFPVTASEYYTAERKKELLHFATAWMERESIMLSEISQAVKDKYHMISPISGT